MWQAPNAQKNGGKGKKGGLRLHIRRVNAEMRTVQPQNALEAAVSIPVRVILNDLSPQAVELFSSQPFHPGQDVALMLKAPSILYLRGKILYCQEHDSNGHVISDQAFTYRVGIQFVFEAQTEAQAVQKYYNENVLPLLSSAA
jgi:hypothetical protein